MEGFKMNEIKYPTETTYFIAYTDTTTFAYGIVNSEQVMDSGQPYLYTTLSEKEWLEELKNNFNVDYTEEEVN
jgi:hypothetical protein